MSQESLKQIYEEFSNMVFNLALSYVQNTQDAEEITQDVFLKIHNNLADFKKNSSLKTWIYRLTINTSLDFIKAKNRKKRSFFLRAVSSDEHHYEPANFNHPGIELEQKEALENLFKHINSLPEKQKTVLILLKIEMHTQAEVAEIMETSVKAVESLFSRAKANLKKKL